MLAGERNEVEVFSKGRRKRGGQTSEEGNAPLRRKKPMKGVGKELARKKGVGCLRPRI